MSGNTLNDTKRILVFHNRYLQTGGEDIVFSDEVTMLRGHGHEVHEIQTDNQQMVQLSALGAAVRTVWNRPMLRQVSREIAAFRPDVMHVHNDFPYASPSIYYAGQGVPVVQTLHNFRGMCANGVFFRDGQTCTDCVGRTLPIPAIRHGCYRHSKAASLAVSTRQTAHRLLGTWHRRIAAFIAPTQCVRDQYVAGGYPAERIFVKNNFVTGDPPPGSGGGGYMAFVGRLTAEKGIGKLLDAWRDVPGSWRLKIVGDGPARSEVQAAAADPLRRIDYLGKVAADQVHHCLTHADAAVVPSIMLEAFCRVVAEAFAAGTPVLAVDHGGPGELVDHQRTGLLYRANQPQALRETLHRAWANPATLAAMRPACRQAFETRFTDAANYPQLLAIYRRATGRAHANDPLHTDPTSPTSNGVQPA